MMPLHARADAAVAAWRPRLRVVETGVVTAVGGGIVTVAGLPRVGADEVVHFEHGAVGLALDLREREVGVLLLSGADVRVGEGARRSHEVLSTPVGDALLGRVIDPLGRPLDGGRPLSARERWPIERPATPITARAPVRRPLHTGVMIVDTLFPIGRRQRELILGDRQAGKSTLALTAVAAQVGGDVRSVVCAVGQPGSETVRAIADLRRAGALGSACVLVAGSHDPVGLRVVAPFAAMTIAERWMEDGHDVLIVFDDLTAHARAYREASLLLRRPPGREAYPGDIFHLHARLLERATARRAGGSITALPIVETQAQDVAAFVPTNLISITDGQLVLTTTLAQRGVRPALDVGLSVSRVGGKAQSAAQRTVAPTLRLAAAQFEELEAFARFGSELDADTRRRLAHGRRVRAILGQPPFHALEVGAQVLTLWAVGSGVFDAVAIADVPAQAAALREAAALEIPDVLARLTEGAPRTDGDESAFHALASRVVKRDGDA